MQAFGQAFYGRSAAYDAALTEEALITFCRRQLTGYKVPKLVEFRDELPKSNVGKILRRELRDEARAKVDNKA